VRPWLEKEYKIWLNPRRRGSGQRHFCRDPQPSLFSLSPHCLCPSPSSPSLHSLDPSISLSVFVCLGLLKLCFFFFFEQLSLSVRGRDRNKKYIFFIILFIFIFKYKLLFYYYFLSGTHVRLMALESLRRDPSHQPAPIQSILD
jgi:hypothetical protein